MQVEMLPKNPNSIAGKKTELTHIKGNRGWKKFNGTSSGINRIVYLGNCKEDGDTFAIYYGGLISFCKGFLNNGVLQ